MKAYFKWTLITAAVCLLLFTGFSEQLLAKKFLAVPRQISPANNSHFTHYPRKLTVRWQRVKTAVSYEVEIDCYHCRKTGQWDSENGPAWKTDKVKNTAYSFVFPGDNKGRWRVRATRGRQHSAWSPWWYFDFKTSAAGSSGSTGKLPDLRVWDIRLKKNCQIQVTIQNIGAVGVPDSYYNLPNAVGIQMYKDSQPWGGLILKGFDPAGQLKLPGSTVRYTWFPAAANLKLGPGTHSIKVVVDHGNVLTEADETNNSMTKRLTCKGGLGLKPGTVTGTKAP